MTVNGGHAIGLFFAYGWRGQVGPYYVGGANSVEQSIDRAREALTRWKRTVAKNVRTGETVWDSQDPKP
jgi:hypothetical protein